MNSIESLAIKICADGADRKGILQLYVKPYIKGLTTNPTLMRKAGVSNYEGFAREILETVRDKPISFEVFSDDFAEMRRQALKIASWGGNVYVKIPITNTRGESSLPLVKDLAADGVKLNITAILTLDQVEGVAASLEAKVAAVVSVFAGRIADTGVSPEPVMHASKELLKQLPKAELLWASVREVLNVFQAAQCGCDITTVPHDILVKLETFCGKDLRALSLETVQMFANDAAQAGYHL
jgi:transaldolase